MTAWWTPETSNMIGAFGGAGVGILGGILGTAIGVLAPKGIGRSVVLGMQMAVAGLGAGCLVTGIVAVVIGQPYTVWYPLVLIGFVATAVLGGLIPVTRNAYRHAEQRKLDAQEMLRS